MADRPKLVVGLGNPGKEYVGTRHNIGFAIVDALAAKLDCSLRNRTKFAGEVGEAGRVTVLKPQTFMNRSGTAVAALVNWLKLAPVEVLVVVDDADLPLGQLRLRLAGGSGGHNGLRSITESLGSEEFRRLRVGIGRREAVGADITNHVLGRFTAAERPAVDEAVSAAVAAIECCLSDGFAVAMNRFNRKKGDEV
ncbi:MAG: Peptidyl-tRNA hydrolase [Verrucomicrobiae bacterium]|nr:Peptidyl-tRNA hydrolase [Verrucomicrobiae bacterium]